jgi:hypothetical protein
MSPSNGRSAAGSRSQGWVRLSTTESASAQDSASDVGGLGVAQGHRVERPAHRNVRAGTP